MQRVVKSLMLAAAWCGACTNVWAQGMDSGMDSGMMSSTSQSEVTAGTLKDETVAIRPQIGIMSYTDAADSTTSRMTYGFNLDWNLTNSIVGPSPMYFGIDSGFFYSHLGSATSNLFGTSANQDVSAAGANMFLIPANLKIGYNTTNDSRISLHGGGNVIYRSVANSVNFGASSVGTEAKWRIYPNLGADFEVGLGKSVSFIARPDFTFAPGPDLFTGTLGVGFALG